MYLWDLMTYSLLDVKGSLGGDLNMFEWKGDMDGGINIANFGLEKKVWSHCKAILKVIDPNWKQKGLD